MNNFKLLLTSSLLVLAGFAGTVQASLYSVYVGIQCQPLSALDADNLTYMSDNLLNNSDELVYVSCPIMRRNARNTNGTRGAYAIISGSNNASARCDFQSRTRQGGHADFRTGTTTSYMGMVNLDVNASGSLGTYSLFCTLPPGGRIHSYGVEEYDDTTPDYPTLEINPENQATLNP